jgi:hypothetical protein
MIVAASDDGFPPSKQSQIVEGTQGEVKSGFCAEFFDSEI